MEHHSSTAAADQTPPSRVIPWESIEARTASAFTTGGILLTASLLVPVGLAVVTEWAWISGLLLVGLGTTAVVVGLLGLYPTARARSPRLSTVGVLSTAVAGLSALGLLAMAGLALVGAGTTGAAPGTPMRLFSVVALSMASGFSVGFLSFGIQGWRSGQPSRAAGRLLLLGGGLLLVPVVGELARFGVGIGPPSWLLLPVIGLVSLDTLALGLTLHSDE